MGQEGIESGEEGGGEIRDFKEVWGQASAERAGFVGDADVRGDGGAAWREEL